MVRRKRLVNRLLSHAITSDGEACLSARAEMPSDHNHVPGTRCCQHDIFEGESLFKAISVESCTALNEETSSSFKRVLRPYEQRLVKTMYCDSSDDPEMILNIVFTSTVRVKALCLVSNPAPGVPARLRLFTNRPTLSFEEANDGSAAQEISPAVDGDPEASAWHTLQVCACGHDISPRHLTATYVAPAPAHVEVSRVHIWVEGFSDAPKAHIYPVCQHAN